MSLSYLEAELVAKAPAASGRLARLRTAATAARPDIAAGYHDVTSSPLFASVMLRVGASLALGFVLVRIMKFYTA